MSQTKARKKPGVVRFFEGIAEFFISTVKAFVEGDIFVKLSALLCGTSCFARKQYLKGFFICLIQAAIMLVFPTFFFPYMSKLSTLGTVQQKRVFNPETMKNEFNDYDNSFLILLFGVLGVVLLNVQNGYNFIESVVYGITGGLGFLLAIFLFAAIREQLEVSSENPKAFDGFPIALVTAGLIALAFMGFSGLKVW